MQTETITAKRDFRAMYIMKLHERCVDVCDMILKCDKAIGNAKDGVNRWHKCAHFDMPRLMWSLEEMEKPVHKYESIKQRLTKWYIEIMDRIQAFAIDYLESKTLIVND